MKMGPSRIFLFLYPISVQLAVIVAQQNELKQFCIDKGNFSTNSIYQTNLNQALTSLSSNTEIKYGFYNSSFGQDPDKVNAMSLCRGDKKPDTCLACIRNSSQVLRQLCPNEKEAIIWYDDCMLRYSNRTILGSMEFGPIFWMYNENNVSDATRFLQVLNSLLGNLTNQAASGNSLLKFATGNANASNDQTMYALVQCTPDLSNQQCSDCLTKATDLTTQCCTGRQGGRVVAPSCYFRYEKDIFYDPTAQMLAPSGPTPGSEPEATPSFGLAPSPSNTASREGTSSQVAVTVFIGILALLLLKKF